MMEKVGLEVGGEVGSGDGSSVGKDVKGGFNVRIDNIIVWGVYIGVCGWVCRVVNGEVNMSNL